MSTETKAPAARAPRWMKITLVLSLAVNLAIAGLVAGFALRGPVWRPDRDGMAPLMQGLPPSQMRALRDELREHGDSLREGLRAQRDLSERLATALRVEPFDVQNFEAVLRDQRTRITQLQAIGHDALVARVRGMSADERRAYADALSRGAQGGHGRDN